MPPLDFDQMADPRVLDRIRNEPVLMLAVVGALLTCLVQFGVSISDGQQNAVTGLTWALLALVARAKVTPVRKSVPSHRLDG